MSELGKSWLIYIDVLIKLSVTSAVEVSLAILDIIATENQWGDQASATRAQGRKEKLKGGGGEIERWDDNWEQ